MSRTKQAMSTQLPPTPCTEKMRTEIVQIAKSQGKSIAEIQREAFALFLSQSESKAIGNDIEDFEKEILA